jgi:hypothetical protein
MHRHRPVTTLRGARPEYAIAGTYREFMEWQRRHAQTDVRFLTKERAEMYLARGARPGVLHRIGNWQTSPALDAALSLEERVTEA